LMECENTSVEVGSTNQTVHRAVEYIKQIEAARKSSLRGMGHTAMPVRLVDTWTNPEPTEYNQA
jgi:hypothetical protein